MLVELTNEEKNSIEDSLFTQIALMKSLEKKNPENYSQINGEVIIKNCYTIMEKIDAYLWLGQYGIK